MTSKIGTELERLRVENEGADKPKKELQKEAEELKRLQQDVVSAIRKSEETSAAGEAALSDAYLKLEAFATNKLPLLIRTNIEAVAQVEIKSALDKILLPLKEDIGGVVLDVESCRIKLRKLSWNWRLFFGPVAAGVIAVMIGTCLVYFFMIGEMRRYAKWGRVVESKIETFSPKSRDLLFNDFGRP